MTAVAGTKQRRLVPPSDTNDGLGLGKHASLFGGSEQHIVKHQRNQNDVHK